MRKFPGNDGHKRHGNAICKDACDAATNIHIVKTTGNVTLKYSFVYVRKIIFFNKICNNRIYTKVVATCKIKIHSNRNEIFPVTKLIFFLAL